MPLLSINSAAISIYGSEMQIHVQDGECIKGNQDTESSSLKSYIQVDA